MTDNLSSGDYVGMSFWLISMALVAATAFFFVERDRVAGKWKTSLTVSGLVTLIAAVHYFYMRDVWVATGTSPTEFRYIDWLLTVPLLMVEFYLIMSAVGKVPGRVFWNLGMNPALNVKDYMTKVGPDTEFVFNDAFWGKLNFVVNAVDNIHARLYVDGRCVWYEKPLLESGTLGTKANSQMIVPHVTQCYGDSQDPPEEAIPMCTLRNFPNQIEHCIEWGRDKFNSLFVDVPADAVSYLDNPKLFIHQLKTNNTSSGMKSSLTNLKDFIGYQQEGKFENCVRLARVCFDDYYNYTIKDLLSLFPKDAKDKEGAPFWSGPKRCPTPIAFDVNNKQHVEFIGRTYRISNFR